MDHGLPEDLYENGGFPEPADPESVRVVAVRHQGCGTRTRVRLPTVVPPEAVRRVRCAHCEETYETSGAEEIDPGRTWRWLSVPVGAAAVIGALLLIQGGGSPPSSSPGESAARASSAEGGGRDAAHASDADAPEAELVRGARFALALPSGWQQRRAQASAAFAATAPGGAADATLWIERNPDLDLDAFEARSLEQLRSLAGSARVVERVSAASPEATIIRLAADAPKGEPQFEVTLRAAGPYRYYLATTLKPDASSAAADGIELIHGSFIPELGEAS